MTIVLKAFEGDERRMYVVVEVLDDYTVNLGKSTRCRQCRLPIIMQMKIKRH